MKNVTFENVNTGKLTSEKVGFAWAALLFNCFYLLYRRDWVSFVVCILLYGLFSLLPAGWYGALFLLIGITICFFYNRIRIEFLLRHGWSAKEENDDQILINYNIHTNTNKEMAKKKPITKETPAASSNKSEEPSTFEKVNGALSALSSLGGIHCPRCFSKNVQVVGQHKKAFSAGKAIAGTALAGGIGSLAGFAGKRTKKVDMICLDCGKKFKK